MFYLKVVVSQGKEPPCFLQLFQGGLVIHKGMREQASAKAGEFRVLWNIFPLIHTGKEAVIFNVFLVVEWRLFCVRGELPEEGSLLEVDCSCAGLRSRGSVVLLNHHQGVLYLWTGCKAHSSIREVSRKSVERLTQM